MTSVLPLQCYKCIIVALFISDWTIMDDIILEQYSIHHVNVEANELIRPEGTADSGLWHLSK